MDFDSKSLHFDSNFENTSPVEDNSQSNRTQVANNFAAASAAKKVFLTRYFLPITVHYSDASHSGSQPARPHHY